MINTVRNRQYIGRRSIASTIPCILFYTRLFLELLQLLNNVIPRQVENEGNGFFVMEGVDRIYFSMYVLAYPAAAPLCGRRR